MLVQLMLALLFLTINSISRVICYQDSIELSIGSQNCEKALKDLQQKTEANAKAIESLTQLTKTYHRPEKYGSCSDILRSNPDAKSGEYTLVVNGKDVTMYCEMGTEGKCGGEGGWARLAYVNMAEGSSCPSGLYTYTRGGKKLCDRNQASRGGRCDSTFITTKGLSYNKICGRVRGYQYDGSGYIDGMFNNHRGVNNLNSYYVDGVSITHGNPRKHVWTFANGNTDVDTGGYGCPCNSGSRAPSSPSYVGNNYYCESGTPSFRRNAFHGNDPLWDGKNCNNKEAACCTNTNLPYFVRTLPQSSTDNIELRVCSSEGLPDEACGVDLIEIYIK